MAKKYYWLKLKRDFFKRHDMRIIEEMDNGKDYILFYLKLLLMGLEDEKVKYNMSQIKNINGGEKLFINVIITFVKNAEMKG